MKKNNLVVLTLLSIIALTSCNNGRKEYEVVSIDNIKYLLYDGVDKVAAVVGYNYGLANEINLPSEVNGYPLKAISKEAFKYSSLSKITIPDSISYIGSSAFVGCANLKDVTLPNTIETLPSNIFKSCYSLTNITLPNNISLIDDGAFLGCYSLTNITMPNSLFGVGSYAFAGCESLNNVDFSETRLYDIGSYCFYDCNKLSNISLSNSIKIIAEKSFSNCSSLKKIFIPKSISTDYTYMGEDIFYKCHNDLKILFEGSKLPYLYSPTFSSGYPFALGTNKDTDLNDVFVKDSNIQYSINNYKTNPTAFLLYADNNIAGDIAVPKQISSPNFPNVNVTEIMPGAFYNKDALTSIDLSELSTNLKYIGAEAFYNDNKLTTVTLPSEDNTDIYLGAGVFNKCSKLSTINNLDKIKDLELHGYTFAECYSLGKGTPFSFTSNIKYITSTDFKDWGNVEDQKIELKADTYDIDAGGTIILRAKGDKNGDIWETIKLTKTSSPDQYSNPKYFGNAIITLGS